MAAGRSITLLGMVADLNRLLGTKVEPEFAPPRAGDIRESLADITQARQCLGYEPSVSFEEGLRRSIDYYRSVIGR
jgi:UDP-glucose 4-epimerase